MIGHARRLGIFAWAWPTGSVDQLLRAAAHVKESEAQVAWRRWVGAKDLDDVRFNEMRLLAAVAPRLKRLDPTHPARNQIVGIGRMLWSRSQMVLREVQPAFAALRQADVETMILKGAARVARDPTSLRLRFVNDVDVLVHPRDFRRAFDLLDVTGWRSTSTGSAHFHRTQLDRVHGINLIRGNLADLDLHRSAFHHPHESLADDSLMWSRSDVGLLACCPTRVPSATDTVVIALAHGGQGGHRTSDWLLDIVDAINSGAVAWNLLQDVIERRKLDVPAAVALTYLAAKLQIPVPPRVLDQIVARARRASLGLLTGLMLSHPKNDFSRPLKLVRVAAKMWQLRGKKSSRNRGPEGITLRARSLWKTPSAEVSPPTYQAAIELPDREPGNAWQGIVEATIALPATSKARRMEFELNTKTRHVARLTHRTLTDCATKLTLQFRVPVELGSDDDDLILESVSARGLRPNAPRRSTDRYARIPFSVVDVRCQGKSLVRRGLLAYCQVG